ncbi:hypothetical protein D9M69_423070 [compost metagenome]
MGWHHRGQLLAQPRERLQVAGADLLQAALVGGDRHVGVGLGPAVAREVLAGRRHAGGVHAADEGAGQRRGPLGVTLEGAAADHGAALVVEVENRREAEVEPDRQHLGRHQPAALLGQPLGIGVVGQGAHRRQAHEALAQTLHPSAFLVDGEQQVRAHGTDRRGQLAYLARVLDIAGEQDQTADLRLAENLPVFGGQPGAGDVQHQGALQA